MKNRGKTRRLFPFPPGEKATLTSYPFPWPVGAGCSGPFLLSRKPATSPFNPPIRRTGKGDGSFLVLLWVTAVSPPFIYSSPLLFSPSFFVISSPPIFSALPFSEEKRGISTPFSRMVALAADTFSALFFFSRGRMAFAFPLFHHPFGSFYA